MAVDEDEIVTFLAVALFYKRKSAFSTTETLAQDILDNCAEGDTATFTEWLRFLTWKMGGTKLRQLVAPADGLRLRFSEHLLC